MRLRLFFAAISVGVACAAAAACGLDESGLMSDASTDTTMGDVIGTDAPGPMDVQIDVPTACATLDATACVDAEPPDGWTYAVVATGDLACPPGDYENETTYDTTPTPNSGACACGCDASGSYSCAGSLPTGSKPSCNNSQTLGPYDAGNDAECVDPGWNDPHILVGPLPPPTPMNVACTPSENGTHAFTTAHATACTPGCSADYCGAGASGFNRCIVTTTQAPTLLACPNPFTRGPFAIGAAGNVSVTCAGCGCTVDASAPCTATVTPFQGDTCTGGPLFDGGYAANGTCNQVPSGMVNSYLYVPKIPQPVCTPSVAPAGDASFSESLTLCCLP